jgi:ADP-ribosylglycohydrolase
MLPHPHSTPHSARNHAKGVLLGLAVGDRNGGPIRMALQLADSLVTLGRFDPTAILQRYLAWWQTEGFDTGPIAAQVFSLIASGIAPTSAVAEVHDANAGLTAGCNPAHRSAPLAMAAFLPDHQLAEYAYAEAALTHHDRLAGDVAAAVVRLCRALIHGTPWLTAIQIASAERSPATIAALLTASDPPQFRDGFAPHVLQAALHFVHRAEQVAPALEAALAFAGAANYCPVLVGAIGGARWGAAQIESHLLAHCKLVPHIHETADRLAQPWPE